MESLIKSGNLISHQICLEEIMPKTKKPDLLGEWIKDKASIFKKITPRQIEIVTEILEKFPGLIDYKKEKDEADPWIIALAKEEMEKKDLFSAEREIILASEESTRSSIKIPAVCREFGVNHMTLFEFFQNMGWSFKLQKSR